MKDERDLSQTAQVQNTKGWQDLRQVQNDTLRRRADVCKASGLLLAERILRNELKRRN